MEEIKQDDLREEWIKALENPLMFSRDVGNETFDWWISKILSQRQKDRDMLREEAKKSFEANLLDGDNINDCGSTILDAKMVYEWLSDFLTDQSNK